MDLGLEIENNTSLGACLRQFRCGGRVGGRSGALGGAVALFFILGGGSGGLGADGCAAPAAGRAAASPNARGKRLCTSPPP